MARPRIEHRIIDGTERKRCCRCHEWLTLDEFWPNRGAWDKLQSACRNCCKPGGIKPKPHRSNHATIDGVDHKLCGRCQHMVPVDHFNHRAASWDGLAAKCRPCDAAAAREWFQANRGRAYENTRNWVKANPAGRAAIQKRWQTANADVSAKWRRDNAAHRKLKRAAYYKANKEASATYSKAWRKANPDASRALARAYATRRRARILALPHEDWTDHQIVDRDGLTCWMCSKPVGYTLPHGARDWHVDHLIPLAAEYPDHPGDTLPNLGIACAQCNYNKSARLLPAAIVRYEANRAGQSRELGEAC